MKYFPLFIIVVSIFLFSFSAHGQNWIWAKGSSNGGGEGNAACTDINGNVFVTGGFGYSSTITFGSTILTNAGGWDIFLAKYDALGNLLWAKSMGGTENDEAFSVCTDASGDVFITGYFMSPTITFGSTTLTNNTTTPSGANIFLAKYDALGNLLWAKSAGGTNDDEGYSISADANGNVFITGFFSSPTIAFGSTILSNQGIFVAKYDASGNALWAKSSAVISNAQGYGTSIDKNGNLFVTGYYSSPSITFGSITLTNPSGGGAILIVKYDPLGNALWARSAGGSGDVGYSVSVDVNGNAFIAGSFESPTLVFGSNTLTNAGFNDVFIAKYDSSGNILWAKSAGGTNADIGYSVSADTGGGVFLVGSFYSSSITFGSIILTPPLRYVDPMFIVKYDQNGNVLCASVLASGGDDRNSVSVDPFGNAFVGGDYQINPFVVGFDTLVQPGGEDIFVAKYTCSCPLKSSISGNTTVCSGVSTILSTTGGTSYLWSNGETTSSIQVTPNSSIIYSVVVSNVDCSDTTAISIHVNPNPTVTTSGNVTIFPNQNATLTVNGGSSYLWNTSETTTTILVAPTVTTVYCVTVSDTNSCKDSTCVTVFIESPCDTAGTFFFPNAFSPNNDGDNDYLKVYYKEMNCITSLHLIIYDRWGEQVYETSDKNFSWDGTYPDKTLNTQVLAYHLTVGFTDGKAINRKGNISLVR